MWSKTAAVAGCLGVVLAASTLNAAEVNVIASTAMREVLEEFVPMFERASGHKVAVSFQSGAVLPVKIKEGAQADLVVTTPETIDDLVKAGKVVADTRADFVRSGAGVAVRSGAPKPDASARPRRSRPLCWPQSRWATARVRAACISWPRWRGSGSPIRSRPRESCRRWASGSAH